MNVKIVWYREFGKRNDDVHLQEIIELAETRTADDFAVRTRLLFKIVGRRAIGSTAINTFADY